MSRHRDHRHAAIVIGCGDVGSAIAHALHVAGYAVVLTDHVDPPWARRGMGFTDAWYIGHAELDSAVACFCASVRTVATLLAQRLIAATTWSWAGIAQALSPAVVVDARMQADRSPSVLIGGATLTIGVGAGFLPGVHVDLVVDGDADAPPDVDPRLIVRADGPGWFMTSCRVGARVRAGETVGHVGRRPFIVPADGVLRGVSARGARVHPGVVVIEVDPGGDPASCFGLGERQRRTAARVVYALEAHGARAAGFAAGPSTSTSAIGVTG